MRTQIKKVRLQPEYKNPIYTVKLESPDGKELFIKFDYTYRMKGYMPLKVNYDGENKGAQLAWYTRDVEGMSVGAFLESIADRVNKKYNFELHTEN